MELRVSIFQRRVGRQLHWSTLGLGRYETHVFGPTDSKVQRRLVEALRKRLEKAWPEDLVDLESVRGRRLEVVELELNLGTGGTRRRFRGKVTLVIEPRTRGPGLEDDLTVVYHPLRTDEWFVHEPRHSLVEAAQLFFRERWATLDDDELASMRASPKDRLRLVAVSVTTRSLADKLKDGEDNKLAFLGAPPRDKGEALLAQLGTNQTLRAIDGTLEVGLPRSPYREQLQQMLCGHDKTSVLLVGPSGVGKSTLIRRLVHDLLEADGFVTHRNLDRVHRIWEVLGRRLIAGMSYLGQWEQRCVDLLQACRERKAVLWVGDIQAWGRIGESRESDRSLATFFRGPLHRGELVVIGECTPEGLVQLQQDAPGLASAFTTVFVEPTDRTTTMKMLIHEGRNLEQQHGIAFDPRAFSTVYEMGGSLGSGKTYPGKALDLLRSLASGVHGVSTDLHRVESEVRAGRKIQAIRYYREITGCGLKQAKDAVERFMARGTWPALDHATRPPQLQPRSLLDEDFTTAGGGPVIGPQDVVRALSRRTGIPELLLTPQRSLDGAHLLDLLGGQIMGQPSAVEAMRDLVLRIKAGLTDTARPYGVFLFTGPTGTGKTEMAKCIAEYLYGDATRLLRFDMSEYSGADAPSRLIGDRWQPEGTLTSKVKVQPFCVVLLDEIEKASPAVLNLLLQLFDDGRLTDATGITVDFTHTVVIMTSNLGSTATPSVGFEASIDASRQTVDAAVREFFPPELFNRIDRIVPFSPLGQESARRIARRELGKLLARKGLTERNIFVRFTESVVDLVVREGFNQRDGARSLKRWLEDRIGGYLADEIAGTEAAAVRMFWLYRREGTLQLAGQHLREASAMGNGSAFEELIGFNAGRLREEIPRALRRAEALIESDALLALARALGGSLSQAGAGDEAAADAVYNLERLRTELRDIAEVLRTQATHDPVLAESGDIETRTEHAAALLEAEASSRMHRPIKQGPYLRIRARERDPRHVSPALPLQNRPAFLDALGSLHFLEQALEHATDLGQHAVLIELTRISRSNADSRFAAQSAGLLEWLAEAYRHGRGETEDAAVVSEDGTIERVRGFAGQARIRAVLRIVGPGVRSFYAGEHGTHVRESLTGGTEIVRVRVLEAGSSTPVRHLQSLAEQREAFVRSLESGQLGQGLDAAENPDVVLPLVRRYRYDPAEHGELAAIEVEDHPLAYTTATRVRHLHEILPTLWLLRLGAGASAREVSA